MKRLALLGISALVACSNSPTAPDLSALDLSGRWTFLDSATAVQVDTDVVYATVVARGTVVLDTLGTDTYTMSEGFSLHFTLIDSTARLELYESNSAGLVQDTVVVRGDSLFGLTPDPIVAPPATISAREISLQESRVDPVTTDPDAIGCGRAVSLFTRLGSAHPSSCTETLLLVKQPQVIIKDFSYSPSNLTISVGTTVTWVNMGQYTHTVTADGLQFDSGNIAPGSSFQYQFTQASAPGYHCTLHHPSSYPTFRGTITVK